MQALDLPYIGSRFVNGVSLHSTVALGLIKKPQYLGLLSLVDLLDRFPSTDDQGQDRREGIGFTQLVQYLDHHREYGVISPSDKISNAASWRYLEIREVEYHLPSGAASTMKRVFLTQKARDLLENALASAAHRNL